MVFSSNSLLCFLCQTLLWAAVIQSLSCFMSFSHEFLLFSEDSNFVHDIQLQPL
jgi:hypothetical protein